MCILCKEKPYQLRVHRYKRNRSGKQGETERSDLTVAQNRMKKPAAVSNGVLVGRGVSMSNLVSVGRRRQSE